MQTSCSRCPIFGMKGYILVRDNAHLMRWFLELRQTKSSILKMILEFIESLVIEPLSNYSDMYDLANFTLKMSSSQNN